MGRIKHWWSEWRADRAGRVPLPNDMQRAARDLTGPTGWAASETWDHLAKDRKAYLKSFDPRVPASLHISERDRVRAGLVMPLAERCIEDWAGDHTKPGDESFDEAPGGIGATESAVGDEHDEHDEGPHGTAT